MAKPLTDDEREEIIGMIRAGRGCNDIAREVGRSNNAVSRIAASIGHTWGRDNLARAQEARLAYGAEQRAEVASLAIQRAREILADFEATQPVVLGGQFPTVRDLALDARAQKDRAQAAQLLTRTVLDIARVDEKADEGQAKGLLERLVEGLDAVADAGS